MDGSESRRDYTSALLELQLRLQGGEHPDDAMAFLESRGMPKNEARLTVRRIVEKSIKEQRTKGAIWLGLAVVCVAIASPYLVAFIAGLGADQMPRGYRTSMAQAGALPGLLLVAAVWLGHRGLRLLLSRRYAADPDR